MLIVAIDPGKQGAMCALDTFEGTPYFQDNPDHKKITVNRVNIWLSNFGKGADCIVIEDVHSMHNMSAKSNFQFGRNLGIVETLANLCSLDVCYLQPKEWQTLCDIKFVYPNKATAAQKAKIRKDTTAARCNELYPNAAIYGPMGGLKDGRADALMIAHAMYKFCLGGGNVNANKA
jgi:hypothetical protein